MQNLLGDLITRIYNGQQARLGAIILHPATPKSCLLVLDLLRDEGYILGYNLWYDPKLKRTFLKVLLKYSAYGAPAIKKIFQISKPTRRIYISTVILWKPKASAGLYILSTPKGLLTDRDARLLNVGGELLLGIY